MVRTLTAFVLVSMMLVPTLRAEERTSEIVAPTAAVAAAWKQEAKPSTTLRALLVTYGAVQGLDMGTTIAARNRGAREANPLMRGSYLTGGITKAALAVTTMLAVRSMERKSRKAAIVTMIAANLATAAVAAHNLHVAAHQGR